LLAHDLVGKPVPTFPDHALAISADAMRLTPAGISRAA
jgi:hypothetical protein